MKKFEFLEHTADAKIRIYGNSLEDLFKNALLGMAEIQNQNAKIKNQNDKSVPLRQVAEEATKLKNRKTIKIESIDLESLLVDFLSEVLTLSDTNQEVYPEVSSIKIENNSLEAEILGFKVDKFDEVIKAVTYHGVKIEEEKGRWVAEVIFDI